VLERCANVTLFGQREHADLPKYVKAFDVGIVPYLLTEYTANVYPTKLNEYLSMGIPVVATDLPEIRRFNRDHGDVVDVAATADAFAAAIRQALDRVSTPAVVARRVAVAESNSWGSRIAAMSQLIEGAIARRASSDQRWDQALRRIYRARAPGRRGRRRTGRRVHARIPDQPHLARGAAASDVGAAGNRRCHRRLPGWRR